MFSENSEELAQNKLILLYIVREAGYGFTKDEITEFILKELYELLLHTTIFEWVGGFKFYWPCREPR